MLKRASIKDIARLANVSHSTVSRALRGSRLISDQTTERIRRIAMESGYRASAAARSLVTRRSGTIGVVVTNISDPFAAEVVQGIEDAANVHGISVFLANSNADANREVSVVHSFEERRVDGIVVTSSRVGAEYAAVLSQTRIPIVLLNNQHPGGFLHSVMIDNKRSSREITDHLVDLGHRRIAYIGDRFGQQSDAERMTGFRLALKRGGIKLRRDFVTHGDGKPEEGERAMDRLLRLKPAPTAVFCYNDMTALGAMHAARAHGLKIPRDVSVAGFDDVFFAQYLDPPLTTVRQPMREMGRRAMETLMLVLAGTACPLDIKVPGELIVRSSTTTPKEGK